MQVARARPVVSSSEQRGLFIESAGMCNRNSDFVRLLKQHDRRLAAYVFSMVTDWSDAEDIIQDTWVRLWEQFDDYRPEEDFGAWACTIARYLVMAYRKRTQRHKLTFSSRVIDLLDEQVAAGRTECENRVRVLADCVRKLSDSARDLLRRCYGRPVKIKDIARELNRSVNGLYLALSRIRRILHDCVEAEIGEGEE